MELNHGQAYTAFLALNQIRGMVKGMDALHVFSLKNQLKPAIDFIAEEEVKLVGDYGGTITETGMILIPDKEKRPAYMKARQELDNLPLQNQPEPITIQIDRCPDVTAEQIEQLAGFVNFTEVNNNGNQ